MRGDEIVTQGCMQLCQQNQGVGQSCPARHIDMHTLMRIDVCVHTCPSIYVCDTRLRVEWKLTRNFLRRPNVQGSKCMGRC